MEINLFWNLFFLSALSQGFFVALVLLIQYAKRKHVSQMVLGLFIVVFGFVLLNNLVYWNELFSEFPQFLFTTISLRFLLAPLFYMYCKTFFTKPFGKKDFLHFLPFIIITAIYSQVVFLSGAEKLEIMSGFAEGEYPSAFRMIFGKYVNWLLAIQLIAYPLLIFKKIRAQSEKEEEKRDGQKTVQMKWLFFLNSLFLIYGLLMLVYFILVALQVGGIQKDFYISMVMCIAVYCISYVGMMNPELLKGETFLEKLQPGKYAKTKLDNDYLESVISQLNQLMIAEQAYLETDFGLGHVAQKINLPKHHITQALSLRLGKSFHEYINKYRVEHAQKLLADLPKGENVKTVMFASGFNNRVSFNNNFKKFTGKTASQFLKEHQLKSQ